MNTPGTARSSEGPERRLAARILRGATFIALPLLLLACVSSTLLLPEPTREAAVGLPGSDAEAPHREPPPPALLPSGLRKCRVLTREDLAVPAPEVAGSLSGPSTAVPAAALPVAGRVSAAPLEVLVVDEATGRPVPLAHVEVTTRDGMLQLVADDTGRVRPPIAATDRVRVTAWTPEGRVPATGGPVELDVDAAAPRRLVVELQPAVAVEGRVHDAGTGRPIAGAEVSLWTFAETDVVRTDANGRFRHPRVPADTTAEQIRVTAEGFGSCVRYLELDPGGAWHLVAPHSGVEGHSGTSLPARVDIGLVPALLLSGRVLDPQGRPVAGASVLAEGYVHLLPSVASRDEARTVTGPDGTFELRHLRSDVGHAVRIDAPGFASRVVEAPLLDADAPNGNLDLGDVVLEVESVIAGVVVDPSGHPVRDARIRLIPSGDTPTTTPHSPMDAGARLATARVESRTSFEGTFLFDGLGAGDYRVQVRRDRGTIARAELSLSANERLGDVRLDLDEGVFALVGEVVDSDGPVPHAQVEVVRFGEVARVAADETGAFRVAGLDDSATYEILARDGDGVTSRAMTWVHEHPVLHLDALQTVAAAR